jgi:hypothetical protein
MNLYIVSLTVKGIMLLTQSNNWEKSDIFINHTDTLHCTTERLESNTSNDRHPNGFLQFSTTTNHILQRSAQRSVCMTHVTRCWWRGVVAAVTRSLLHAPSFCLNEYYSVTTDNPGYSAVSVAYPGIFFGGGGAVQQIQLRTEGRENGDLGAVAP